MIIDSTKTTVAYRCPECGATVVGVVGMFSLSADMIRLKCKCGGSALTVKYTSDGKIRLSVPCILCPNPHNFVLGSASFFQRELFTLPCSYCDINICFIGSEAAVEQAVSESDSELEGILGEAGCEDLDALIAAVSDLKQEAENEADPQTCEIVRFMLAELKEDGCISCHCPSGSGDYDFSVTGTQARVFCRECGASVTLSLESVTDADAFINCDSLTLT